MRWVFVIASLVSLTTGCGSKKDPGPPCEQVVDHMLEVTKTNLPGHEGTNLGGGAQKKAMINACEARHWDADVRTCLVGAQSISDIAKCRGGKSDVFERPRRPRVPVAGSGSGSGAAPFVHPPTTGSATTGSATTGSAATGSATTGSATGTGSGSSGRSSGSGGSGSGSSSKK